MLTDGDAASNKQWMFTVEVLSFSLYYRKWWWFFSVQFPTR